MIIFFNYTLTQILFGKVTCEKFSKHSFCSENTPGCTVHGAGAPSTCGLRGATLTWRNEPTHLLSSSTPTRLEFSKASGVSLCLAAHSFPRPPVAPGLRQGRCPAPPSALAPGLASVQHRPAPVCTAPPPPLCHDLRDVLHLGKPSGKSGDSRAGGNPSPTRDRDRACPPGTPQSRVMFYEKATLWQKSCPQCHLHFAVRLIL